MGKTKQTLSLSESWFLLALASGRRTHFMTIGEKMNSFMRSMGMGVRPFTPMDQPYFDMMAAPLRKRGLIKGACGVYQITEAGKALLREGVKIL